MRVVIAFAICAATTGVARADQCAWIGDKSIAERAATMLREHPTYVELCEPCGDKAPGEPAIAHRVEVQPSPDPGSEVAIDGRAIDLAYIYVQISDREYDNLAALAGCMTSDVSPTLVVDQATANGVLIHASTMPVSQPPPPPAMPATPAGLPGPQVIYVVNERGERDAVWPIAVATGCATTLACLAFALLRRRRRAFEPRAAKLDD